MSSSISSETRKKIAHAIAGIVILIHGYEKWEHHSNLWWVFLFFGVLALALVANHKKLHHHFPSIDAVFFLIEGTLMFITAYYYFSHGKKYFPYGYIIAGILYVAMTFYKHRKLSRKV